MSPEAYGGLLLSDALEQYKDAGDGDGNVFVLFVHPVPLVQLMA